MDRTIPGLLGIHFSMSVIAWLQQLLPHCLAIQARRRHFRKTGLPSVVKPDAVEQVRKTGVAAHGIKEGMYLEVLQNA
jgi:hypothetical protein